MWSQKIQQKRTYVNINIYILKQKRSKKKKTEGY